MEFKIGKDSGGSQPGEASGEKKKQSALLVLLLILVGGFTYIYFFTGLIKPLEAEKTAEAPVADAPQVVKMPLPAREGEAAKPAAKVVAAAPVTPPPAAKPAAAPAKPAVAPAAKTVPAAAPPKPKGEPKKAEAAKPAEKKSQAAGVAENSGEAKKPVVADKKGAPATDAQAKPEADAKTKKTTNDAWTLVVGNYVLEEALSADMGSVRKAGFQPIVKPSSRKKSAMNRLLVSEFNDRASALSSLEKLKRHTSDAFVIEQGGKFAVYAGSYLQTEAANSERERLNAAGFSITIKHTDIAIPSQSLAVGPFKSKKAADAALGKLKSVGIKATFSQK